MTYSNATSPAGLETKQGLLFLHIQGTPFQMGIQHGSALKEKIHQNIEQYLKKKPESLLEKNDDRLQDFLKAIPLILSHIPQKYIEEMKGVAEGADVSFNDILLLNLFPEMFHCCGVTVSKSASKDGSLYHARVLDYSAGKGLQSSAVLFMTQPSKGIPFLNITYAGFIGSVTGMNEEKISIGEIGGQGYGNWDGMPMSFLLRSILEQARSLKEAKEILSHTARTCEYYYIIADGKTDESLACYATSTQIQFLFSGEDYSIDHPTEKTSELSLIKGLSLSPLSSFFSQPTDTLLLTGLSSPERYPVLLDRINEQLGFLDAETLMEIIKRPVALESNLHNVIFHPSSLTLWIAHAHLNGNPACNEPYVCFTFKDLK